MGHQKRSVGLKSPCSTRSFRPYVRHTKELDSESQDYHDVDIQVESIMIYEKENICD